MPMMEPRGSFRARCHHATGHLPEELPTWRHPGPGVFPGRIMVKRRSEWIIELHSEWEEVVGPFVRLFT